jgi:Cu2+-exporting ATPase
MSQSSLLENTLDSKVKKITLDVGGMKCAGCVKVVERKLSEHPGVKSACVNLVTEVAVVEYEANTVDPAELAERVVAAGFTAQPRINQVGTGETITTEDPATQQRREMQAAVRQLLIAALLLVLSTLGHFSQWTTGLLPLLGNIWLHCGFATIVLLGPGRPIIVDGWRGIRHNAPNMNTLVGLGTLTAYTASVVALLFPRLGWECFFDEPVMLLGFILLGRTLEQQARGRAANAFWKLLALQPQVARLVAKSHAMGNGGGTGGVVEIPAEQVRVGEWLQVLPGEKIPVDGEVIAGHTTVDESMLTGEAIPASKQPGDLVTGGTLNQSGVITIQATRTGKDTTIAQIVALVEAAQTRKAPVQKLADTVAGYFTYGVLTAAVLTFLFWYFIGSHIWHDVTWLGAMPMAHQHSALHTHQYGQGIALPLPLISTGKALPYPYHSALLLSLKLAIAVMVVACPCALGLATPTAILVGTGMGAERGLLIKGGDVLERVHQLDTVVFDKTGTLTAGKPTVTDCLPISDMAEAKQENLPTSCNTQSLLQLAAAVESGSNHPLAVAIVQAARQQELSIPDALDFYTEPGLGVSAVVAGQLVLLGNGDWLTQQGVTIPDTVGKTATELALTGKTVVYLAVAGILAGIIAVQDPLRPDAVQVVNQLRQMGLNVMLLTGDRQEAAYTIAQQLGLSQAQVYAEVRPHQKAAIIQQLQANTRKQGDKTIQTSGLLTRNSVVAMVGDGINDAPALSVADVGISLHGATDVAMEVAQIVLMRDRLTDVVQAIELSRATFNKIRQNLFWAFAYNTLGIPVAAGILLPSMGFVLNPALSGALMAFSSVSVVTNSLLLRWLHRNFYE